MGIGWVVLGIITLITGLLSAWLLCCFGGILILIAVVIIIFYLLSENEGSRRSVYYRPLPPVGDGQTQGSSFRHCPYCDRLISKDAAVCPYCGAK